MFGKSITRREAPPLRRVQRMPGLPLRALALGLVAVAGSGYAIVRHYSRHVPAVSAPGAREIPAPELVPVER